MYSQLEKCVFWILTFRCCILYTDSAILPMIPDALCVGGAQHEEDRSKPSLCVHSTSLHARTGTNKTYTNSYIYSTCCTVNGVFSQHRKNVFD